MPLPYTFLKILDRIEFHGLKPFFIIGKEIFMKGVERSNKNVKKKPQSSLQEKRKKKREDREAKGK